MVNEATITSKKTPTRTCIACGKSDAKKRLVRFVRNKDGMVECDEDGRAAGRGAYICANAECFSMAEKRKRLEWALKCQLSHEDYQRLGDTFREVCDRYEQTV